jgi:hypothetical protein
MYVPSAPGSAFVLPEHQHIAGDGEQADDEVEDKLWGDCGACYHGGDRCLTRRDREKNE